MSTRKRRWLWLVLALLGLVAAGAFWLYRTARHRPTAHRHVPAGSAVVVRADGVALVTFKPVRDHLWPVLLRARLEGGSVPDGRAQRIADETGVRLPDDLREAVVASTDGVAWVLLLGGKLEHGRFVDGLLRVFEAEGTPGWARDGELLVHSLGVAVGQADDGTLVVGTTAAIARAALPAADEDEGGELPVAVEGAIAFRLTRTATHRAIDSFASSLPGLEILGHVDRAAGVVTLSESPRVELTLVPREGTTPKQLASELEGALTKLRFVLLAVPHGLFGGKQAIADATVSVVDAAAHVTAPWPYEPLDRAIAELAVTIGARRGDAPNP